MTVIDRRGMILGAAGLVVVRKAALATESPDATYRRAIVIDTLSFEGPSFDPRPAIQAGLTGVVLDIEAFPRDTPHAVTELDAWNQAIAAPGSLFHRILHAADFAEAKRLGKLGILLNTQDASVLGTPEYSNGPQNIETLSLLYGKGLRILQLTYTNNNGLGSGYADAFETPLTRLGRAVVAEMNRLGMLIDTSHCSEATTLDAIQRSLQPVAVTHGGCYSLYPDKRNKSDRVIRALAEKGGYMGIYNMTMWMTARSASSVEVIVDHIDHAVKIGGINLVGFGSDHEVLGDNRPQADQMKMMSNFISRNQGWPGGEPLNGHVTASDLNQPDRLEVLANALARRRYTNDQIEKIIGGNFLRVLAATIG